MTRWLFHWMLRLSYSSELGAATAYDGHAKSLRKRSDEEANLVAQVRDDELEHRAQLLLMMQQRGLKRFLPFEVFFLCLGTSVSLGCKFWGAWASAFGASLFEVNGVLEFNRLAHLARKLGEDELVAHFEKMAEQEDVHRVLFRKLARGELS